MSQIPKYTGRWQDWDQGRALGNTITLTVRHTLFLTGATAILVTFVTGSLWHIFAFFAHRYLSSRQNPDMLTLQHRVILRNNTAATAALKQTLKVYWTWKPWECCTKRDNHRRLLRRRPRRARHLLRRTCCLIAPALLIFAGLTIAGVFVTKIARDANDLNFILVKSGYNQGHCGVINFRNIPAARAAIDEKGANDTRAAISYARSCYRLVNGVVNSAACSRYVTKNLPYSADATECPFSPDSEIFEDSMCSFNGVQQAHRLRTPKLDSHIHFGVNAPKSDRVQIQKEAICSPIRIDGYTSRGEATGSRQDQNVTITNYNYGPLSGVSNYTYSYNTAAVNDIVPFQVTTVVARAATPNGWAPITRLERVDADVTIVFIAPNSIRYRAPSNDPVFRSQYCLPHDYGDGKPYEDCDPYNQVSVIGCTERYMLCNPNLRADQCTRPGGQEELPDLSKALHLNAAQNATASRLMYMLKDGNIFGSIDGVGAEALQISSRVYNFFAPAAAQNQWQIEVEGWMETTLAKWQANVVEFAINTADLGGEGKIGFPLTDNTLENEWQHQCANQKVANLGDYQNISVFGLAFTWTVCFLIIAFALGLEHIVSWWRKRRGTAIKSGSRERRIAWNIDGALQQQRVALRSADYTHLIGGSDDVPYINKEASSLLPFESTEATFDGRSKPDTIYKSTVGGVSGVVNGAPLASPISSHISQAVSSLSRQSSLTPVHSNEATSSQASPIHANFDLSPMEPAQPDIDENSALAQRAETPDQGIGTSSPQTQANHT